MTSLASRLDKAEHANHRNLISQRDDIKGQIEAVRKSGRIVTSAMEDRLFSRNTRSSEVQAILAGAKPNLHPPLSDKDRAAVYAQMNALLDTSHGRSMTVEEQATFDDLSDRLDARGKAVPTLPQPVQAQVPKAGITPVDPIPARGPAMTTHAHSGDASAGAVVAALASAHRNAINGRRSNSAADAGRAQAVASMRAALGKHGTGPDAAAGQSASQNMAAELRRAGMTPNLPGRA